MKQIVGCAALAAMCLTACGVDQHVGFADGSPPADDGFTADNPGAGDSEPACISEDYEVDYVVAPVDFVIALDASASMRQELAAIEAAINVHFADVLDASGVDYRVILLGKFGRPDWKKATKGICVPPPLGGNDDCADVEPGDTPVHVPGKFYHYDMSIASNESWCKILRSLDGDVDGSHQGAKDFPEGWRSLLREDAQKVLAVITDDRIKGCNNGTEPSAYGHNPNVASQVVDAAVAFDADLLQRAPEQFGIAEARRYRWYTIGGFLANAPASVPYTPDDAWQSERCSTSFAAGLAYQELSNLTDGWRFPVCEGLNFDALFEHMAQQTAEVVAVPCQIQLPKDQEVAEKTIEVTYTSGGDATLLTQVEPQDCDAASFYLDGDVVTLCPTTCAVIQADDTAQLGLTAACPPRLE